MIAKGNLHAHGQVLAAYLITGKMHERAELVELRGFAAGNIRDAFIDVMIQAEATRCEKPFFHAHVRLPDGEQLGREQWLKVADRIERQLGFEGQGRAVAFHMDQQTGEKHLHIAWSRIDLDQMRAIDPGLFKNKLKDVCRQLEKELGLTRVRNERDSEQKTLSPNRNEFEQARRLGTDLKEIRETIRDCWERSDTGRGFEAALAEQGYILARGDRRDFVVIDPAGGDHALGKRIVGVAAPEIRTRLADIDKQQLPSVDQAKTQQAELDRTAPDRARPLVTIETPAIVAPEPAQTHDQREAPAAPQEQQPASASPTHAAGLRKPDDIVSRVAGGIMSAFAAVLDALADMFSPPPPPTPDQAKRQALVAEEQQEAARAAEQKAQHDRLLDQIARDDAQRRRDEERTRDDYDQSRGRERER
jgi:hypothetical protein